VLGALDSLSGLVIAVMFAAACSDDDADSRPGFAVEGSDEEVSLYVNDTDFGSPVVVQFHPQTKVADIEILAPNDLTEPLTVCNVDVGTPPNAKTGEPCTTIIAGAVHRVTLSEHTGDHVAIELAGSPGVEVQQIVITYEPVDRFVTVHW
jgi:hypothetical protein